MGKYKKGILGYFRGKVGTVIGSIWKGIHYMRSVSEASSSEPTQAQLNVRLRFALVVEFLTHIKGMIGTGYQKFNKGVTPFNAAVSYLLKYTVTGTSPNYTIDYSKVIVSVGDLEQLPDAAAVTSDPAEIKFNWDANTNMEYGKATDLVSVLAYSAVLHKYVKVTDVVPRSALTYTLSLPAEFSGELVHCWLTLTSVDRKQVCESSYLGPVTVL